MSNADEKCAYCHECDKCYADNDGGGMVLRMRERRRRMTDIRKDVAQDGSEITLTLHIRKEELGQALINILAEQIADGRAYTDTEYGIRDGVKEAVKETVYAQKDEIIDKVVARATTEIVRKGIPKLLEKVETETTVIQNGESNMTITDVGTMTL